MGLVGGLFFSKSAALQLADCEKHGHESGFYNPGRKPGCRA